MKDRETKRFENMSVTPKKGKNGRCDLNCLNLSPLNQLTELTITLHGRYNWSVLNLIPFNQVTELTITLHSYYIAYW